MGGTGKVTAGGPKINKTGLSLPQTEGNTDRLFREMARYASSRELRKWRGLEGTMLNPREGSYRPTLALPDGVGMRSPSSMGQGPVIGNRPQDLPKPSPSPVEPAREVRVAPAPSQPVAAASPFTLNVQPPTPRPMPAAPSPASAPQSMQAVAPGAMQSVATTGILGSLGVVAPTDLKKRLALALPRPR